MNCSIFESVTSKIQTGHPIAVEPVRSITSLTQNERELRRRKQDLQAAAEERQQVVGVRGAELGEQLLLSAAEGRLLRPVERHNLTGHLTGNESDNTHHTSSDLRTHPAAHPV